MFTFCVTKYVKRVDETSQLFDNIRIFSVIIAFTHFAVYFICFIQSRA